MITMKDIVREGHPSLRVKAKDVNLPLSAEDIKIGNDMLTFLKNSQDEEIAEKYELRAGIGIAAPQIAVEKRIIALHLLDDRERLISHVLYNPNIVSHSVEDACLAGGEGCLSVDRDVPGYVVRHMRVTVSAFDINSKPVKLRFKGYPAMCVQHEIDHINGIMFYDHINDKDPYELKDTVTVID